MQPIGAKPRLRLKAQLNNAQRLPTVRHAAALKPVKLGDRPKVRIIMRDQPGGRTGQGQAAPAANAETRQLGWEGRGGEQAADGAATHAAGGAAPKAVVRRVKLRVRANDDAPRLEDGQFVE